MVKSKQCIYEFICVGHGTFTCVCDIGQESDDHNGVLLNNKGRRCGQTYEVIKLIFVTCLVHLVSNMWTNISKSRFYLVSHTKNEKSKQSIFTNTYLVMLDIKWQNWRHWHSNFVLYKLSCAKFWIFIL